MSDREEREKHIEQLEALLEGMQRCEEVMSTPNRIKAIEYAISSIKTDQKYDLLYEGKENTEPTTKNDLAHNLCDSCTNIRCEFQSGIVRTECAFYMSPHLEPDNCGNYAVQGSTTKNDLGVDCISRKELLKIYEDRFCELQKLKHLKDNKGAEDRQMGVNYCINVLKELPSVTPQEPILDKIRAEIEHTEIVYDKSTDYKDDRTDAEKAADQWKMDKLIVLGIIDKYKAESEPQESEE